MSTYLPNTGVTLHPTGQKTALAASVFERSFPFGSRSLGVFVPKVICSHAGAQNQRVFWPIVIRQVPLERSEQA